MDELEQYKKQHENSYRKAVLDNIENNTNSLFNEDIASLIKKPPLDSMDSIKNKLLSLAKKNKIVLNTMELDTLLDNYRSELLKSFNKLQISRISTLTDKVETYELKNNDIIKINKKDFNNINKEIKKTFKENISSYSDKIIIKKIDDIFSKDTTNDIRESISEELSKYINKNYQKQILEGIEVKVLIKDTTLINNVKELGERYLFTLNNSKLLNID